MTTDQQASAPAHEAYYAEMMTETAKSWHAASLQNAFDHTGGNVYCPVSGDKIALMREPYGHHHGERSKAIANRAFSTDQLWEEGAL